MMCYLLKYKVDTYLDLCNYSLVFCACEIEDDHFMRLSTCSTKPPSYGINITWILKIQLATLICHGFALIELFVIN